MIDDILDNIEKDLIGQFYAHERMREAVKKVLLMGLSQGEIFQLIAESNEATGANLKAACAGIKRVENAFRNMAKFEKKEPRESKINIAR